MNLYNVLLNNKIPFVLLESGKAENVIYCKSFSDYLFNVGTFVTKSKEVILEYVTEDNEKYVVTDVTFENGECFRNVRFKVVVNENVETPHSTINLNLLTNKTKVELPKQQKQIIKESEEVIRAGFDHLISIVGNANVQEKIDADGFVSPVSAALVMNYDQAIPYHSTVIKNLLERIEQLEADIKKLNNT